MQANPTLRARIDGGRVVWQGIDGKRWETLKRFLDQQDVDITIGKRRKKSTRKQREYYWPVIVTMIAHAAGYIGTKEELQLVHDGLRARFLTVPREESGSVLPVIRSTESLTTVEREDYHEKCRHFGAEYFGIYIPDPNEIIDE